MVDLTFQVAIAGFGRAADVHLEAWRSLDHTKVVAVADPSPLARERARSMGIEAFDDLETALIEFPKVDAVSICSPTVFHAQQARAAMSLGAGVLCEAPAGVSSDGTQRLVDGIQRHAAPFQVASKFRHLPQVRKAQSLIRNGVIGTPLVFRMEFANHVNMEKRWNSQPRYSGGGVWMDLGFHATDLVRFLISPIVRIQGTALKARQRIAVEDSAWMVTNTECGATGTILTSWSLKRSSDTYFSIEGTEGRVELGWTKSFLQVHGEAPVVIGSGFSEVVAHKRMMSMFRALCLDHEEGWISPEDIRASSLAVEAGYRSILSGRWIRVPSPPGIRHRLAIAR